MEYYLPSQIPSSNCVCVCVLVCVMHALTHSVCGLPVCVLGACKYGLENVAKFIFSVSVPGTLPGWRGTSCVTHDALSRKPPFDKFSLQKTLSEKSFDLAVQR